MSYVIKCNGENFSTKIPTEAQGRSLFKHYCRPRKNATYRFQLYNPDGICIMDETSSKQGSDKAVAKAEAEKAKV